MPVAISITGVWMSEHPAGLRWLLQRERRQIKRRDWRLFDLRSSSRK